MNETSEPFQLDWLAACSIETPSLCNVARLYTGRWSQELQAIDHPLDGPSIRQISRGGRSGHKSWPTVVFSKKPIESNQGEVYAAHLPYSGNHCLNIDCLPDGTKLLQMGYHLDPHELTVQPKDTHQCPPVYSCWSNQGTNGVLKNFHKFIRRKKPTIENQNTRKVHINTWEAVYFNQSETQLLDLATNAIRLGTERFVLDDGWFQGRRDAKTSLGDWNVDPEVFPSGLGSFISKIHELGMDFGLWVEPEMVSKKSHLYETKPHWILGSELTNPPTWRGQFVLDLTQEDVREFIFQSVNRLLSNFEISYLKWDHNRELFPSWDSKFRPVSFYYNQYLQELLEKIKHKHPRIEIETCASGGGRADLGMLIHCGRIWASDNTDPMVRIGQQKNLSTIVPLEMIGSHVGSNPSEISGQSHCMWTKVAVSIFGHFGLELDPRKLADSDAEIIKQGIDLYKKYRDTIHSGQLFHFLVDKSLSGQLIVSDDKKTCLIQLTQETLQPLTQSPSIKIENIPSLDYLLKLESELPESIQRLFPAYKRLREGIVVNGKDLGTIGLGLPQLLPGTAHLISLIATTS